MAVYKFRVTFDDFDDVHRDIEIKSVQTFEDLHKCLQSSIGFDGSQLASFYMSNDNWTKGREITLMERSSNKDKKVDLMKNSRLCDFILDPHQKIYYISDFIAMWCFRVELVKIIVDPEAGATYPRCVKTIGDAPKQYGGAVVPPPVPEEEFDESAAGELEEEESADEGIVEKDELPEGGFVAEVEGDFETADDADEEVEESNDGEEF